MPKELNIIIKSVVKNNLIIGVTLFLILILFNRFKISIITVLGLITSMLNFIISAFITNKFINKVNKKTILFTLSYFIRIIIVVTIAAIFSNKISYLLAFLMGFIINYIGLLVATIKGQRGSE